MRLFLFLFLSFLGLQASAQDSCIVILTQTTQMDGSTLIVANASSVMGQTAESYLFTGANVTLTSTNNTFTVDAPGFYCITANMTNGCTATSCIQVGSPINLCTTYIAVTDSFPNGAIEFTANTVGGTAPYSYLWSNGAITQTVLWSPFLSQSVIVTVTDSEGCVSTSSWGVNTDPCADFTGYIYAESFLPPLQLTAIANGGTMPYTYTWSTGETTESITDPGQIVTVVVADANNCAFTTSFSSGDTTIVDSCGGSYIYFEINGIAGTTLATITAYPSFISDATFQWNTGETGNSITVNMPISGETYCTTATATEGSCVASGCAVNGGPCYFNVAIVPADSMGIDILMAIPSGGVAPYTYAWSNNETQPYITAVPGEVASVLVTDANGCMGSIDYYNGFTSPCFPEITPDTIGGLTVSSPCDTNIISIVWSDGSTNTTIYPTDTTGIICATLVLSNGLAYTVCYQLGAFDAPGVWEMAGTVNSPSNDEVFGTLWLILNDPANGMVVVDSFPYCTNPLGWYDFSNLPAGNYTIWADVDPNCPGAPFAAPAYAGWAPNFWENSTTFSIPQTGSGEFSLTLASIAQLDLGEFDINGLIDLIPFKDPDAEGIIRTFQEAGANVYLYHNTLGLVGYTQTDETGGFSFQNLPEAEYEVCIDMLNEAKQCSGSFPLNDANPTKTVTVEYTNSNNDALKNKFTVSPNPTGGVSRLQFEAPFTNDTRIEVIDLTGRTLFSKILVAGEQSTSIDLSGRATGLYIIRVPETGQAFKLVKN